MILVTESLVLIYQQLKLKTHLINYQLLKNWLLKTSLLFQIAVLNSNTLKLVNYHTKKDFQNLP